MGRFGCTTSQTIAPLFSVSQFHALCICLRVSVSVCLHVFLYITVCICVRACVCVCVCVLCGCAILAAGAQSLLATASYEGDLSSTGRKYHEVACRQEGASCVDGGKNLGNGRGGLLSTGGGSLVNGMEISCRGKRESLVDWGEAFSSTTWTESSVVKSSVIEDSVRELSSKF